MKNEGQGGVDDGDRAGDEHIQQIGQRNQRERRGANANTDTDECLVTEVTDNGPVKPQLNKYDQGHPDRKTGYQQLIRAGQPGTLSKP